MGAKLTHSQLVELGQYLGYPLSTGICRGFSMMLCQAWLVEESYKFFYRLKCIESYDNDFEKLKYDIEQIRLHTKNYGFFNYPEETEIFLEIPAFYEGIQLYLNPARYFELFSQYLNQENLEDLFNCIS
ncbi:hypothetical protein [Legionella busanensis]|nr:hypothetical protein [Legionella busanensis]